MRLPPGLKRPNPQDVKDGRFSNPHDEARRRWGRARVLPGGLSPRRTGARRVRPRQPGTAAERRLVERVIGRHLSAGELTEAIKLLRAGAKLKEMEINERIESILRPDE